MSHSDDAQIDRLDAAMRRFYATHRRSLRWWKHAREYVSLLRLVRKGLLRSQPEPKDGLTSQYDSKDAKRIPDHPPWPPSQGAQWPEWRWNTPDGKAPFRY